MFIYPENLTDGTVLIWEVFGRSLMMYITACEQLISVVFPSCWPIFVKVEAYVGLRRLGA